MVLPQYGPSTMEQQHSDQQERVDVQRRWFHSVVYTQTRTLHKKRLHKNQSRSQNHGLWIRLIRTVSLTSTSTCPLLLFSFLPFPFPPAFPQLSPTLIVSHSINNASGGYHCGK